MLMIPFLQQTAQFYFNTEQALDKFCFVFPTRRSIVFFRRFLCAQIKERGGQTPVPAPMMLTVNEFFHKAVKMKAADRITLLLELYECYKDLNPKAEPLDEFIFWGDIILADFNDIDKYLIDPGQLYTNVSDLKSIEDTFEYLTENQRKAIESFIGHFKVQDRKITVGTGTSRDAKEDFKLIWNIMHPLYVSFNERLKEKGLAYEGMVYRSLAEQIDSRPVTDVLIQGFGEAGPRKFVFAGLNALNECEKKTLRKMRDASLAEFCWDWSGEMIRDSLNKASLFMRENIKEFKPSFIPDPEGVGYPEINIISVPSATGQAKQLPEILARHDDCAIVLPDESMLIPVLNSIPPQIEDINVTMGYPISSSALYALMDDLAVMQIHIRNTNGKISFYHKNVSAVLGSTIIRHIMDDEAVALSKKIKSESRYYVQEESFQGVPLFEMLFRDASEDFASYQQEVISYIAPKLSDDPQMALEMQFAKEYYMCVSRLKAMNLSIRLVTYVRLLQQLLSPVNVPFRGEPLKGLQIMGPLEIRALDFRNLIILSANENVFPRHSASSSFIPPELRKGFGLPTYEYQDAMWAYYFYRMISRAENVWLMYDSRTEGLNTGEESRYIKQLRYHFGRPLKEYAVSSDIKSPEQKDSIAKTPEHIQKAMQMTYSASALNNYIACPMLFYYSSIERLRVDDEISESLDASKIGTIWHDTMRALLFSEEAMLSDDDVPALISSGKVPQGKVTREYLKSWLNREDEIKKKVRSQICRWLRTDEVKGRNLIIENVIVRYVRQAIVRDIELLDSRGRGYFDIFGLERVFNSEIHGFRFTGTIDRLDSLEPGCVRVVDYKSGKDSSKVLKVTDKSVASRFNLAFSEKNKDHKKGKAVFQFFLYDRLLRNESDFSSLHIQNSMYAVKEIFKEELEANDLHEELYSQIDERLKALMEEIINPEIPFRMTSDKEHCKYCDFKTICGR